MNRLGHAPQPLASAGGRRCYQAGFTLVELMISMAIGLLIVVALVTLLVNTNRSNSEMSKTNRAIENGRFALQLLQADISLAAFWDGFIPQFDDLVITGVPVDYPTAVPDPCVAFASWTAAYKTNLIGMAVQAYEIPATVPSPTLSVCASKVISPQPSTDVLFVRHVENCVPGVGACTALTAGDLSFQVARFGTTTPSPAYILDSYSTTTFTLQDRNGTLADSRRFVSNLYYIRNYAVTAGDGVPTLMRSQFGLSGGVLDHKAAEALVEGIEGFRVEFGVDSVGKSGAAPNFAAAVSWTDVNNKTTPTNRGDGIPEGAYVHCTTATPCTMDQLASSVAVKVYVLVRSENKTAGYTDVKTYNLGSTTLGPFNDGYRRHLYSQTIRLVNVSTRREVP
jgi:type IV pilus assembly protein PilW